MDSEYSRNRLINDFYMLEGNDESNNDKFNEVYDLFDSDILLIPFYKWEEGFESSEKLEINEEYLDNNLNLKLEKGIKYYEGNDQILLECSKYSPLEMFCLGSAIISTISGLITICDFVTKKYGDNSKTKDNHTTTVIIIDIYYKNKKGAYKYYSYRGKASNFRDRVGTYIKEMMKMNTNSE